MNMNYGNTQKWLQEIQYTQTTLNFFWRYVLQMGLNVEGAHCMVSLIFLEHSCMCLD